MLNIRMPKDQAITKAPNSTNSAINLHHNNWPPNSPHNTPATKPIDANKSSSRTLHY